MIKVLTILITSLTLFQSFCNASERGEKINFCKFVNNQENLDSISEDDYLFKQINASAFSQKLRLKSSNLLKQRLDSIIYQNRTDVNGQWFVSSKKIYTYDEHNNLTLYVKYEWNTSLSAWIPLEKEEYEYNSSGYVKLFVSYKWDAGAWIGFSKKEKVYNENGSIAVSDYYYWDTITKQWMGSQKNEYIYESNGDEILNTQYSWYKDIKTWVPFLKYESTYNETGLRTQYLGFKWDVTNMVWLDYWKAGTTFNQETGLFQSEGYFWDNTTQQWAGSVKREYKYDINGNEILYIAYEWDKTNSSWVGYLKDEKEYNANNVLNYYIAYFWDNANSNWLGNYKSLSIYDEFGNQTQVINHNWDTTNHQWKLQNKSELEFDSTFSFPDLIVPKNLLENNMQYYYTHKLTNFTNYIWNESENQWIATSKFTPYYSETNKTNVPLFNETEIMIYPNPFKDNLIINCNGFSDTISFDLYDAKGRKIYSKEIKNLETIQLENIKSGLYFYHIGLGDKLQIGKLIKD
jgi:hypothetical protein